MPTILVLAEHDDGQLKQATLSAVGFARRVVAEAGGSFDILLIGENVGGTAERLRTVVSLPSLARDVSS